MSAPDDLTIKLDGMELSGWQEIRVTRGVERLVSDFELAMTERFPGTVDVVAKPGQPCEILLGDDLVLTGYVDRYIPEFTPTEHTVRLVGRSKCQDVVDCAAVWPGSQLMNGTVLTIAKTLCEPFGISVNALDDVGAVIPQTNLNVGDTPFDVLEPMARLRGLLMYDDPQGNMVLSGVGKTKAASGFAEGENVEAAGIAYTMDQRFSDYGAFRVKMLAFGDSGNEANLITDVQDPGVPRYRPKFLVADTNDGGFDIAIRRAKWEMVRRVGRSAAVHVIADSWRDSEGKLWTPNTLATVALPRLKLEPVTWLLSEVSFIRNPGGTHAHIVLMHPDSFIPQPFNYQPFPNDLAKAIEESKR
ncbi:phage baseplate assembly protein [Variovorax sp. W6]|uniref:phage baseplate assembly protein n=1 Tax=Variovorax sp. W6 TaxID=3093895 RepID=UPI003D805E12